MFRKNRPIMATTTDVAIRGRPLTQPTAVDPAQFYFFNGSVQSAMYLPFPPAYDETVDGQTTFGRENRPLKSQRVLVVWGPNLAPQLAEAMGASEAFITEYSDEIDVVRIEDGTGVNYVADVSLFCGSVFGIFSGEIIVGFLCVTSGYDDPAPPNANYILDRAILVAPTDEIHSVFYAKDESATPDAATALAYAYTDLASFNFLDGFPDNALVETFFGL